MQLLTPPKTLKEPHTLPCLSCNQSMNSPASPGTEQETLLSKSPDILKVPYALPCFSPSKPQFIINSAGTETWKKILLSVPSEILQCHYTLLQPLQLCKGAVQISQVPGERQTHVFLETLYIDGNRVCLP